eukprot:TRINITY_DN1250_c0_g1_i1.p1 TRINITY_DN1250_c0_g1~~TRINITY_DN1250_c0_g1_i1.p1  ORF type:complete len:277 (-),score=39.29 TRINITY_DN1250_c0_g1_i1:386-1216(-)
MNPTRSDKAKGLILGAFTGDVMGAPFEGESSASIKRELPDGPYQLFDKRELTDIKLSAQLMQLDLGPSQMGEYTDDTECLLALVDSLVSLQGLSGIHVAYTTAYWWCREPDHGGFSVYTFNKLKALCQGVDYDCVVQLEDFPGGSWGNGGAMRIAPVGFVFGEMVGVKEDGRVDSEGLAVFREIVRDAISFTHTHVEAIESAVLVGMCVAYGCMVDDPLSIDQRAFFEYLYSAVENEEMKVRMDVLKEYFEETIFTPLGIRRCYNLGVTNGFKSEA